jgi:hypothetical protein
MYKRCLIILAAALLIAALSGCSHQDETEANKAPAYAGPITETMLQALNEGDYQSYSLAFNEQMSLATPESVFSDTRAFIQKRIGTYKSKKLSDVKVEGAKTTVIYNAKFSLEPADVTVTIIFQKTDDNVSVSDFWLNSPKLWEN